MKNVTVVLTAKEAEDLLRFLIVDNMPEMDERLVPGSEDYIQAEFRQVIEGIALKIRKAQK